MPMSAVRRWTPTLLWGATILLATSIPGRAIPTAPAIPGLDKVVHLGLYAMLGWLVMSAMSRAPAVPGSAMHTPETGALEARSLGAPLRAIGAIALFAALDEWHQQFIPGRGADPLDWAADVTGALLGLALGSFRNRTIMAHARRETRT